MITNLPQWYRIAAIENISEETLEKRSSAIEEMLTNDEAFFFDCVRLYLGKKITDKDFDLKFFTGFNSKDGLYLDDTGLLEKRILAGAILAQWFLESSDFGDQLAYALICGSFGFSEADLINRDIIGKAHGYLQGRAIEERTSAAVSAKVPVLKDETPTAETMVTYVKAVTTYVKNMAAYSDKQIKHSQKRIDRLQEESNIHWWLFRSFSNLKSIPISELESNEACFILAYELSKLMTIKPAPDNSASFLNKSLKEVRELPVEFSVKQATDILTKLNSDFGNVLDAGIYGNLLPLVFAVNQRAESEGDDAWVALYKLSAKIEANYSCPSQQIALQFFNELLLLSIL
ncbi:GTPase-associated system all-helical protein GASH [Mucilaginibacter sp. FT3.2]|uniref:GTPase-associated system all-helical protein GASH n=1 Tax=Mucilaginibacter sp. FT3.2 TaxID=2723090 RepID=UPI00160BDC70|nr:GTPase-associated system all-helical protein GASH [Mucilaginibacter sp. FT3.2]MBB6232427.1 hypothetical protein [Mucilaginibacter sp. FT3.2]